MKTTPSLPVFELCREPWCGLRPRWAWAFAALIAAAAAAFAEAPPLLFANWQMREGLPSNKVTAGLQARDGYIWIGTYEGLARFDGVAMTRFDTARVPGMIDSTVAALCEAPDGAIWIGHDSGAVSRYFAGKFTFYPVTAERKGSRIQNLASDGAGDVWALDVSGHFFRVRDGRVLKLELGGARGIYQMIAGHSGELWIVARGKLSRLVGEKLEVIPFLARMDGYVQGIGARRAGGVWALAGGHLWTHSGTGWGSELGNLISGSAPVFALTELADGTLVGGTFEHGAVFIDPMPPLRQRQLTRRTGFPSDWVSVVFQDMEGGVWLGTGTAGLFRVGERRVEMLAPPDAFQGRAVMSVATVGDNDLWVGTEGSGVYRLRDGRWDVFGREAGISNPYVWSVAPDAEGRVWAGTWGSGSSVLNGDRFVDGLQGGPGTDTGVAAMIPSVRGGLVIGTLQGVLRCHDGHSNWVEPALPRKLTNVRCLLELPDGALWVGCHGQGLGLVDPTGHIEVYTHADGLSSDYIDCLHRDGDGTLWIGLHGGGLNRWKDGHFAAVNSRHGLSDNTIGDIEEDDRGYFWMSSKVGILRVSRAELNACADGRQKRVECLICGMSDGLTTVNCGSSAQPAGAKLQDGRIAFATDRGVAIVDPAAIAPNPIPPPVHIESIKAGDRLVYFGDRAAGPVNILPGENRVEVKYTALSFTGPEKVVFRRQLRPIEAAPLHAGAERSAIYNYLPPGRYVFAVTAANDEGVWNPHGATIDIVVLPHVWQTAWFRATIAGAVLITTAAIAWFVSRRRLQRRLELLERERAIERERTRIANDMHDDLGAQLTAITMLTETAQAQVADPQRLEHRLRQIYDTVRNVTRAMDEIVWAVNPKHDTLESMISYFEKFALDFLGAAGIRCRLDMPFEYPAWSPSSEVRHNLFLCLKEALNNAVRHAGADTVTLALELDDTVCRMSIADNGPGHAAKAAGSPCRDPDRMCSGHGLASMRERMARIGGRCEAGSRPEGGFSVVLIVPMNASADAAVETGHRYL